MSKRGAQGQGDKATGLPTLHDPEEPPVHATAAQLASRKIATAKTRRPIAGARSGFANSQYSNSLQALGNPFSAPVNGVDTQSANMFASSFNQQQGQQQPQQQPSFTFGSSQSFPPAAVNNSSPLFGSPAQSNASFPPQQASPQLNTQSGNNLFTSAATPSGTTSFGAGANNPFAKTTAPSQNQFSSSIFASPTPAGKPNGNLFASFGQPNRNSAGQQQNDSSPGHDSMQISPPITPEKANISTFHTPSISGTLAGATQSQNPASNVFGSQQQNGEVQQPQLFPNAASNSAGQSTVNFFGQSSTAQQKSLPTFNFGQTSQTTDSQSKSSIFNPFLNSTQASTTKIPDGKSVPVVNSASSANGSAPSSALFGSTAPSTAPQGSASVASTTSTIFQFGQPVTTQKPSSEATATKSFFPTNAIDQSMGVSSDKSFGNVTKPANAFYPSVANQDSVSQSASASQLLTPSAPSGFQIKGAATQELSSSELAPTGSINPPTWFDTAQVAAYNTHLRLRSLNAGFRKTLAAMDIDSDWTDTMQAYISEYEKIANASSQSDCLGKRKAGGDLSSEDGKRARSEGNASNNQMLETSAGKSQTAHLFQSIVDNKGADHTSNPPKPSFGGFPTWTPASNDLPKPAETTSSKPFEWIPASKTNSFLKVQSDSNANTVSTSTATNDVNHQQNHFGNNSSKMTAPAKSSEVLTVDPALREISSNSTAVPTFKVPNFGNATSTPNFMGQFGKPVSEDGTKTESSSNGIVAPAFKVPNFGNGSGTPNFMAQFGKRASEDMAKAEAEAKRKRKAEDFDSEEDDEEEWERRDAEKQRQRRAELEALAKTKKPKFVPGKGLVVEDEVDASNPATVPQPPTAEKSEVFSSIAADKLDSDHATAVGKTAFMPITNGESVLSTSGNSKPMANNNIFGYLAQSNGDGTRSGKGDSQSDLVSEEDRSIKSMSSAVAHETIQGDSQAEESSNEDESLEDAARRAAKVEQKSSVQDESNNGNIGNSLFDRISAPNNKAERENAKETEKPGPKNPFSSFGQVNGIPKSGASASENPSSAGDQTWKMDSPIKFGANTAPAFNFTTATPLKPSAADSNTPATSRPFAGLFGNNTPAPTLSLFGHLSTTPAGSPAKAPSAGFTFGAPQNMSSQITSSSVLFPPITAKDGSGLSTAGTSRATTPGAESAGETGDDGVKDADATTDDAEKPLDQTDLTGLTEHELRTEEILFEVGKARILSFNKDSKPSAWETKGLGPLRILKNKESGVVRILARLAPSGKVLVNSRPVNDQKYEHTRNGYAQFMIADVNGQPASYMARMASNADSKRMLEVLQSNATS